MKSPRTPENENERLSELRSYDLINSIGQPAFDEIVQIAADICQTPISLISLITEDKQYLKAKFGLDAEETERAVSFCGHTILNAEQPFIVKSAKSDDRFFNNPLVIGAPHIEFYAGIPLRTNNGYALGSLSVIDTTNRELSESQMSSLKLLSKQVMRLFELRRNTKALESKDQALTQAIRNQNFFASNVCLEMKTALRNIQLSSEVIQNANEKNQNELITRNIDHIKSIISETQEFVTSMDKFTSSLVNIDTEPDSISSSDFSNLINKTSKLLSSQIELSYQENLPNLFLSSSILEHIFRFLFEAIDKSANNQEGIVDIKHSSTKNFPEITVDCNFSNRTSKEDNVKQLFEKGAIEFTVAQQLCCIVNGKLSISVDEIGHASYLLQFPNHS